MPDHPAKPTVPLVGMIVGLLTAGTLLAANSPEIGAIYFPGFHQDDHYDAWFGEGWNEWSLLATAPPRFAGHQVLRPNKGRFDEADPAVMAEQIDLAADHGIDAFIFDWYWYSGVRILQRPLEEGFLQAPNRSRLKFALMWANHDWRDVFPAPVDRDPTVLLPSRTSRGIFSGSWPTAASTTSASRTTGA